MKPQAREGGNVLVFSDGSHIEGLELRLAFPIIMLAIREFFDFSF